MVQYHGLNILKGFAAFFIVGCHIGLAPRTEAGGLVTWFCDMNVGLFASISGFLLVHAFEKDESLSAGKYASKRLGRLLPVYVFWTLFYLCASAFFAVALKGGLSSDKYLNPGFWFDVVFWGGASCHLWFVASLFYAQLFLAFGYVGCRRLPGIHFLLLAMSAVIVFFSTLSDGFLLTYPCRLLGFVILGMAEYCILMKRLIPRRIAILALLGAVTFHCLCAQWIHGFMRDYVLVMAILFLFARKEMPLIGGRWMDLLSRCSLGVFLLHPFFAAGTAAFLSRTVASPFGGGVVLADWFAVYLLALCCTLVLLRRPCFERFMK